MRWQLTVLILAACGDDAAPPDLCELGEQRYSDALAELHAESPACTRDEDCVHISTDVACNGYAVSLCGDVVHRDVAARWDPARVCAPLDAYPPARYECSVQASCAGFGAPVCEQARCTARSRGAR